jgi:hypothetical protein
LTALFLQDVALFSYIVIRVYLFTLQRSPFKTMNIVIWPSLYKNLPRENGSMFSRP